MTTPSLPFDGHQAESLRMVHEPAAVGIGPRPTWYGFLLGFLLGLTAPPYAPVQYILPYEKTRQRPRKEWRSGNDIGRWQEPESAILHSAHLALLSIHKVRGLPK